MRASCWPIECRDARRRILLSRTAVLITSGRIRLRRSGLPVDPDGGDDGNASDKLLDDDAVADNCENDDDRSTDEESGGNSFLPFINSVKLLTRLLGGRIWLCFSIGVDIGASSRKQLAVKAGLTVVYHLRI